MDRIVIILKKKIICSYTGAIYHNIMFIGICTCSRTQVSVSRTTGPLVFYILTAVGVATFYHANLV